MSVEEAPQPSVLEQAARQAAEQAAREVAKKALAKIGAILGAKGATVVAAVVAAIVLIILLIVLLVSVASSAFQSSTAVWPVDIATDTAGNYQASGWAISSRYGWRDDPQGGGAEFHDGIDLTNPQGACPFGYHCGAPSIFDGKVQYVGWDLSTGGDPSKVGGGMLVIVNNGQEDHQFLYAHLEPYRLYVQLQGKIEDEYGRYDDYRGYQAIGTGELQPDLSNGGIEMTCLNDMPNFIPTRAGSGTVVFLYDRPANCTTTVVWGEHGNGWQGWIPDDPRGRWGDGKRADLRWQTPIDPGKQAKDVALRFRAHLVPPPPPPTEVPTDTATLTPEPGGPLPEPSPQAFSRQVLAGRGSVALDDRSGVQLMPTALPVGATPVSTLPTRTGKPRSCETMAGGWTRCIWSFADIPTERERFAAEPNPWIVAAQAYTSTQAIDDHNREDADGPIIPPEQLYPTANGSSALLNLSPSPSLSRTPLAATSTPTAMPASGDTPRPHAQTQPLGIGGPEPYLLVQAMTPTSAPPATPPLRISGMASLTEANLGQVFGYSYAIFSESTTARTITFRAPFGSYLQPIAAGATGGGSCSVSDSNVTCTATVRQNAPITINVTVMLNEDTPPDTLIQVVASVQDDLGSRRTDAVSIRSTPYQAAPTAIPPTQPAAPTPGPTSPPAPTLAPVDTGISVTPQLVDRLLLRAPDAPEHVGVLLTISDSFAEQVQIAMRREAPAIAGAGDVDTFVVSMPVGTIQNYAIPGFGFTVPPDTAPDVQVCVTFEWKGLTSNVTGSTRACTVTADPNAVSPTTAPPSGPGIPGTPDCSPLQLVRLPNVAAPNGKLVETAAASFAEVRAEILERTGVDALSVLADVLRQPSFTTNKPGVLQTSWHKAGRAIDLNQGGPFVRVAEGRKFRLYVGNVDITAIFEAHGWQRIPVQGDTLEWWHYEWHPDGIAWTSAMLQVWDLPTLQSAFPEINWAAIGCAGGSNTGTNDPTINPQESEQMCALGAPTYSSAVETIEGCGPPIKAGDKVYQLDTVLGFVGLTGRTTGPHLHLGMKIKSYEGIYPSVDICTPEWLDGRTPAQGAYCYTDMADPLAFLPRAPGNNMAEEGDPLQQPAAPAAVALRQTSGSQLSGATPTPIIPEGAPYQLPPPNYPNSLVFTPIPAATPVGQYWSPYADGGQYGGGGVAEWFCSVWSGWPWCN